MDIHETFLEAVTNMKILLARGKIGSSQYGIHRLTAMKQLDILYDIGLASNAFPAPTDEKNQKLKNQHLTIQAVLGNDWNIVTLGKLNYCKKIILEWLIMTRLYNVSMDKPKVWSASNAFAEN